MAGTPMLYAQQQLLIHIIICDQLSALFPSPYGSSYADLFKILFSGAADRAGITVAFDEWDATVQHLPPFYEDDATTRHLYIISGSRSDAYGSDPWIVAFRAYIKDGINRGLRFFGICFGHQIIAQSLGGCVKRGPPGFFGAGARSISVVDPEFHGLVRQDRLRICVVHYDMVTQLPPGATLVSTSPEVKNDSYRIGHQVLTFQGHPEIPREFLSKFLDVFGTHESPEKIAHAKETLNSPTDSATIADAALQFFLQ